MSLKAISGEVSRITNGSAIGNALSTSLFGKSSFLRNDERKIDKLTGAIGDVQNVLSDLSGALGMKDNMHIIGRIEQTGTDDFNSDFIGRTLKQIKTKAVTAISYFTGNLQQGGVIIDGYDNFRGDISVALPDMPVMYQTAVTDQVVRNANRISMRVYVDLMHTDDIVQNIKQVFANSLGGLGGTIMNALTGEKLNRAQKALEGLQWIQEYGAPFKVYTPHKVYDNMMIEKIAPVNDQKMNEILAADITFKEIIPTTSLGTKIKTPARKDPAGRTPRPTILCGQACVQPARLSSRQVFSLFSSVSWKPQQLPPQF